ncbi:hypothetical protein GCM10010124_31410 [Pilimelia terevasa]|uniref:Uncharacterized protein n=1 Tax=Pilimelia terevasa TaxID=53372 RepID=A0A8J3BPB9_9ACTN|nr:hypothetical protein GCM10010124_31410 [Pilimelia terevasa]
MSLFTNAWHWMAARTWRRRRAGPNGRLPVALLRQLGADAPDTGFTFAEEAHHIHRSGRPLLPQGRRRGEPIPAVRPGPQIGPFRHLCRSLPPSAGPASGCCGCRPGRLLDQGSRMLSNHLPTPDPRALGNGAVPAPGGRPRRTAPEPRPAAARTAGRRSGWREVDR